MAKTRVFVKGSLPTTEDEDIKEVKSSTKTQDEDYVFEEEKYDRAKLGKAVVKSEPLSDNETFDEKNHKKKKLKSNEDVINIDTDMSQKSVVIFRGNIEKLEELCRSKEVEYEKCVKALGQCKTFLDNIPSCLGSDSNVIAEINKSIEEAKVAERNAYAGVEEAKEKLKRAKEEKAKNARRMRDAARRAKVKGSSSVTPLQSISSNSSQKKDHENNGDNKGLTLVGKEDFIYESYEENGEDSVFRCNDKVFIFKNCSNFSINFMN